MAAILRHDPDPRDFNACRAAEPFTYRDAHKRAGLVRLEGEYGATPLKCPCCRWWHILITEARP